VLALRQPGSGFVALSSPSIPFMFPSMWPMAASGFVPIPSDEFETHCPEKTLHRTALVLMVRASVENEGAAWETVCCSTPADRMRAHNGLQHHRI
jgi:hypothetical protein